MWYVGQDFVSLLLVFHCPFVSYMWVSEIRAQLDRVGISICFREISDGLLLLDDSDMQERSVVIAKTVWTKLLQFIDIMSTALLLVVPNNETDYINILKVIFFNQVQAFGLCTAS